jgi:DNA-binding transcriptional ArsR family regulator
MSVSHDYRQIDPLLASRIRLAAMTLLATVESADFSFLREQIGASDGNLGSHMQKLAAAGYVDEAKRFIKRKQNTRYRLTSAGRRALDSHLALLRAMLDPAGSK